MRPAANRGMSRDRAVSSAPLAAAPGGIGDVASIALAAFAAAELDEHELARCLGTSLGARAWRVVHRMEHGALALSPGKTWLTFKFADDGPSHAHAAALRTLATQLERAAVRRGHLEADRNELEALRMAIDLFAPAVLIVDATLAVVFASDAACEQFGDGGSLRLVLSDGAAFAAIGPLVVAACAGGVPSGLLLVRLGARAIGALVMPVASGLAVLVLSDVHQPRLPDHEALRILLRLSRAEAEILSAMSDGATLAAIAARRRASVETVRSQVKSMLAKLGLKTQGQAIGQACSSLATLRLPSLRVPQSRVHGAPPA